MNKKFSTLMASMLLAGGLLNFVNAETLATYQGEEVEKVTSGNAYIISSNGFVLGVSGDSKSGYNVNVSNAANTNLYFQQLRLSILTNFEYVI